jgi:hypothetical protein
MSGLVPMVDSAMRSRQVLADLGHGHNQGRWMVRSSVVDNSNEITLITIVLLG